VILSILLKRNHLLLAVHKGDDEPPEFYRYDVIGRESGADVSQGYIWDQTGETAKRFYLDASRIAVVLPASVIMAKRIELDNQLNDRIPDYKKWRAGIQLPGDPDLYSYGFIHLMKSFDGKKIETIFFASPAAHVRHLTQALFRADDTRAVELFPEHVGLIRVLDKSIGTGDIPQAALVHCGEDGVVVVFVKDGRFYNGRYFPVGSQNREGLSIDIETYLLSLSDPDESLPLVITGSAEDFKTDWSPIIPAFLNVQDLDFSSVWGAAEFVFAGGKCELSAAL
jgi:hypothetical protein